MIKSNEATIEQMNATICRFMGGDEYDTSRFSLMRNGLHNVIYVTNLKYHTSWDWLMPVIKKIRTMNVLALPGGAGGWIKAAGKMNSALITIDLPKAHEGVYEFLQWYNNQPTNQ